MTNRTYRILPLYFILSLLMFATDPNAAFAQRSKQKQQDRNGSDNSSLFMEANTKKLLGDYDAARELFKKCLEQDPNDAASMYELARLDRIANEPAQALDWALKASEIDPENKWYLKLLAELYQENMDFDNSVKVMEKLVELHPDDLEYMYDLALTHLLVGNYQDAIDSYNKIEDIIGITEEISIQKQKIWQRMGKPDKAVTEIEKLCDAYPDELRYKSILAELYLADGKDKDALKLYKEIAEKDPGNAYIQISLSDYYRKHGEPQKSFEHLKAGFANPNLDIDTKVQIILAYFTAEEYYEKHKEEAKTLANILVETHPDNPKAYSIQADLLYQDKEWGAARTALRKVISLDSSKYVIWEQLLFAESYIEDYEAMRSESQRTIDLFPQQPLPYLFAAVASYQFEEHREMINYLERGIKFVVRNDLLLAEFYNYLGDAYHQVGEDQKAFDAYDAALKINPENSLVLNNYAYYLSLEGKDLDKALVMAEKATKLDPGNESNQDTYGWVLYKLGRYDEALEWIGKAIDNHKTDNAEVLEHYGDVLFRLDRTSEARKYWERALKAGNGGSKFLEKKAKDGVLYE